MPSTLPQILLVIQQAELRQLYHELLVKEEWEVIVAYDIASGLVEMINHDIRVLVIDGTSQPSDSLRMIKVLSTKQSWLHIPVVILNYEGDNALLEKLSERTGAIVPIDSQLINPDDFLKLVRELYEGSFITSKDT